MSGTIGILGGMGPEASIFYKKLAELSAGKTKERQSYILNHIRTGLRFAILRSTLIGIRGERGRVSDNKVNLNEISLNIIPTASSYECR